MGAAFAVLIEIKSTISAENIISWKSRIGYWDTIEQNFIFYEDKIFLSSRTPIKKRDKDACHNI